jgi:S-adenosylmethionine:tRNA ribosyltransferase-isomerase
VRDLPALLSSGDALVFNDTRVIPAELTGIRHRDGHMLRFTANLHKRARPDAWWAFARPGKRLKIGDHLRFGEESEGVACLLGVLDAEVEAKHDRDGILIRFALAGTYLDEAVARLGTTPLPPYIAAKRGQDARDVADYQTVYAREDGSVAAPTAGLHFTDELLDRLRRQGIELHFLTLHVGAGTFLPVKVEDTRDHRMHAEWGLVSPATAKALNAVRSRGNKIVAVGTTALRLLESAADENRVVHPFAAETDIFITPGHRFRAVDALMTNFHLPRSTLFMLVSAFSGLATMRAAYGHAIANGYRFYSYGDASLLFPAEDAR